MELHETSEWPAATFWFGVVVMPLLAFGFTAVRKPRGRQLIGATARVDHVG